MSMFLRVKGFTQEPNSNLIIVDVPVESILDKLLSANMTATSISLVVAKDNHEIEAAANCINEGDVCCPGIEVSAEAEGEKLDCSCTELPNTLHPSIVTYLLSGRRKQEKEDWLACVYDGDRAEGDGSRRIIFVDETVAAGISAREAERKMQMPTTENEADKQLIPKIF